MYGLCPLRPLPFRSSPFRPLAFGPLPIRPLTTWSSSQIVLYHLVLSCFVHLPFGPLVNSPGVHGPLSFRPLTIWSFTDYPHGVLVMNKTFWGPRINLIIHLACIVWPKSRHKWLQYSYKRLMILFFSFSEKNNQFQASYLSTTTLHW